MMRISQWTIAFLAAGALVAGLVACGEEGGDDWTGESYTVAELFAETAELDSTDFVALVDGVVSYEETKKCPAGGYYLRDSANAKEALYLKGFEPDTNVFPAQIDTFVNARVQGSFRPGEKICGEMLCHCQRNLYDVTVSKR